MNGKPITLPGLLAPTHGEMGNYCVFTRSIYVTFQTVFCSLPSGTLGENSAALQISESVGGAEQQQSFNCSNLSKY